MADSPRNCLLEWSQVSVDEKWVKIKGQWYFVLCAVDSISGFPLLIDLYPTLDTVSWTLFFQRFHALYGRPTLIQSDGSPALAAALAELQTRGQNPEGEAALSTLATVGEPSQGSPTSTRLEALIDKLGLL